jgi:transcriptional regulator with XRE-family HTH domain
MMQGLGARLREERERRQIDLATIATSTKVNAALFEGLERDDISRWPAGIFRRSFVRAYAAAIGLDPEATLRDFLEQFPEPVDPPAADRRRCADQHAGVAPLARRPHTGLRLTLDVAPAPSRVGQLLADAGRRAAALALDGGLVLAAASGSYAVSGKFWMPLAVVCLVYYFGATLILAKTPGVRLFASRTGDTDRPAPRRRRPVQLFESEPSVDVAYDRGIGAIASVSGPLSSS